MAEKLLDQMLMDKETTFIDDNDEDVTTIEDIENVQNQQEENACLNNGNENGDPEQHEADVEDKKFTSSIKKIMEPLKFYLQISGSFFLVIFKLIEDIITTYSYSTTEHYNYFVISLLCLIAPSVMFALYMASKYAKRTLDDGKESSLSTALIIFIKNFIFFTPLKICSFIAILRELFAYNKRSCFREFSNEFRETLKELKGDTRIIAFFQRFFASFPQIVLQLYIIIKASDGSEDVNYWIVYSQLAVSGLSLRSLCSSVEREDDGLLSTILSQIGWLLTIFSRGIFLALLASIIEYWILLGCGLHVFALTVYLTLLAYESNVLYSNTEMTKDIREKLKASSFFVILTTFGFQSLVYWPIMFDLNDRNRPAKFFFLIMVENLIILTLVTITNAWSFDFNTIPISSFFQSAHIATTILAMGISLLAMLFLYLYIKWKPKRVEHWKLFLENVSFKSVFPVTYGVYYEYFSVAFTIPVNVSPNDLKDYGKRFGGDDDNN